MPEHVDDAADLGAGDQVVVARRFDEDVDVRDLAGWCGGDVEMVGGVARVRVPTAVGIEVARPGDWIVRVSGGAFARVSRDEFAARFEPHDTETR